MLVTDCINDILKIDKGWVFFKKKSYSLKGEKVEI